MTKIVTLQCGHELDLSETKVLMINLGGENYCPICGEVFCLPITEKNLEVIFNGEE
jgi:hypothetical protein